MDSFTFDPLTATASDLQDLLMKKSLTSVQIVRTYLSQIKEFNHAGIKLNALISVAPEELLVSTAQTLDEERAQGNVRSVLHGVPIILKVFFTSIFSRVYLDSQDTIMTHPCLGLDTTAGSWAFVGAEAKRNATIVDRLTQAGVIVIGKANMSV
jgi:amidase